MSTSTPTTAAGRRLLLGRPEVGRELRPTLALAWPVVLAELGWVAMGVIDTVIVGPLGPGAVGAVGLSSTTFFTAAVFGMGLLLGLDTVVSQAFGAGRIDDCHRALVQAVILALALSVPLTAAVYASGHWLGAAGVNPDVLREATTYLRASAWGTLPLLIFAAFRRYLQGMGVVRPVTFALVSANVVNALANWALVYGRLGAPALGVTGSGWATTLSRVYLALFLVGFTVWHDGRAGAGLRGISWRPDWALLRRLVALGLPASLHVTMEVGVFATAAALAARLDAASLAAHQVVLNVSSVTFMIPYGLGSAGAVRVGQALGRRDPLAASRAGWATLGLAVAFMATSALVFAAAPRAIVAAFSDDPRVLTLGVGLLYLAAGFQVFDGIQGVTTGNLRGAGDTHTPMACNLLAHWGLGLPLGYALAFPAGLGVFGLWLGLAGGLVVAGVVLLLVWIRKTRALAREAVATDAPLG